MNEKLTMRNEAIIKALQPLEIEQFTSKRAKYTYLFELYLVQIQVKEFVNETKLREDSGQESDSFNDLQQHLNRKLVEFIHQLDKEKSDEIAIQELLDTAIAMAKREGCRDICWELFAKAYKKLRKIEKPDYANYWLFLRIIDVYFYIQTVATPKGKVPEEPEFESKEIIQWFGRLAQASAGFPGAQTGYLRQPVELSGLDGFIENPLFYSLKQLFYLLGDYEALKELISEEARQYSFFSEMLGDRKEEVIENEKVEPLLFGLLYLEALYSSFKMGSESEFKQLLREWDMTIIKFKGRIDSLSTWAFLAMHTWEFRLIYGFKKLGNEPDIVNQSPLEIDQNQWKLLYESDMEDIAIRLEINTALTYFYQKDFKKALGYFKVLKDKAPIERRPYLTLYFGICSLKERDFDKLDSALDSLRRSKTKGPSIDIVVKKITKSLNRRDGIRETFTAEEIEAITFNSNNPLDFGLAWWIKEVYQIV